MTASTAELYAELDDLEAIVDAGSDSEPTHVTGDKNSFGKSASAALLDNLAALDALGGESSSDDGGDETVVPIPVPRKLPSALQTPPPMTPSTSPPASMTGPTSSPLRPTHTPEELAAAPHREEVLETAPRSSQSELETQRLRPVDVTRPLATSASVSFSSTPLEPLERSTPLTPLHDRINGIDVASSPYGALDEDGDPRSPAQFLAKLREERAMRSDLAATLLAASRERARLALAGLGTDFTDENLEPGDRCDAACGCTSCSNLSAIAANLGPTGRLNLDFGACPDVSDAQVRAILRAAPVGAPIESLSIARAERVNDETVGVVLSAGYATLSRLHLRDLANVSGACLLSFSGGGGGGGGGGGTRGGGGGYTLARLSALTIEAMPQVSDVALRGLSGRTGALVTLRLGSTAVGDATVLAFLQANKDLRTLDVSGCENVSDSLARSLGGAGAVGHHLTHLDVSGCTRISDSFLTQSVAACPEISLISAVGCRLVSAAAAKKLQAAGVCVFV